MVDSYILTCHWTNSIYNNSAVKRTNERRWFENYYETSRRFKLCKWERSWIYSKLFCFLVLICRRHTRKFFFCDIRRKARFIFAGGGGINEVFCNILLKVIIIKVYFVSIKSATTVKGWVNRENKMPKNAFMQSKMPIGPSEVLVRDALSSTLKWPYEIVNEQSTSTEGREQKMIYPLFPKDLTNRQFYTFLEFFKQLIKGKYFLKNVFLRVLFEEQIVKTKKI